MATEQYRTGLCTVTTGSQVVIGASTEWLTALSLPCVFKVDLDGQSTYSVGQIVSASRIVLAANYLGSTHSSLAYMVCRSFTTNRGYWRPLQGDHDSAEIISQQTVDLIDTDIGKILDGSASLEGTAVDNFQMNNASIDGDLVVAGDSHMRGNASVDGDLVAYAGNVQYYKKVTLTATDLTGAGASQEIDLFGVVAGDRVDDVVVDINSGFRYGGNATICRMEFGDNNDINGFGTSKLCGSIESGYKYDGQGAGDKGAYLFNASGNRVNKVYTGNASLRCKMLASNCMVSSIDGGNIDVYVSMMSFN